MTHAPTADLVRAGGPRRHMPSQRPLLSVVVPMLNEADNIEPLFARLIPVLDGLDVNSEIICIDDGSRDATLQRLRQARSRDIRIKIASLSRNFGKEIALAAGLRYARGDAVVLMDADLQHPPELIPTFVDRWKAGFHIVYGIRRGGSAYTFRGILASVFYAVLSVVSRVRTPRGACDFSLIDRKAVDALNVISERRRFTKGLLDWIGFKNSAVPFDVDLRANGRSGWRNRDLWRLGLDAITSFSTIPLVIWFYLGLLLTALSVFSGAVQSFVYVLGEQSWSLAAVIISALAFFAGMQLMSLGIIGEYIGRLLAEARDRPLFVVAEEVGLSDQESKPAMPSGGDRDAGVQNYLVSGIRTRN